MKPIAIKGLHKLSVLAIVLLIIVSCGNKSNQDKSLVLLSETAVDSLDNIIKDEIVSYKWKISLDHHRMAKEEEAYTPPAIATIFSDSKINSSILENNDPLVAIDLPFKFLAFSEPDLNSVYIACTSADFISKRHDLPFSLLSEFKSRQDSILSHFHKSTISEVDLDQVTKGYAIIKIKSDFDFKETVNKLKETINGISGTKTFGVIDYKKDAETFDIELNPTTLIFFGAPEPGAKAMKNTPKLGLDAFCQKLIILENQEGEVWVAFNDIEKLSRLYYNKSTLPQKTINRRLKKTITGSIQK
jgi:uncharacterized protein (DUF302 family)